MGLKRRTSSLDLPRAVTVLARASGGDPQGAQSALQAARRLNAVDINNLASDAIRQDDDGRSHQHQVHLVRRAIEIVQNDNACDRDSAADLIRVRAAGHGLPITEVAAAIVALGGIGGSDY